MLHVMKRLPLSQLPDFPKDEYWALIFELGDTIEELTDKVADRDARLESALAEISRLTAKTERPVKDSQNASMPPSQDITRHPSPKTPKSSNSKRQRTGHQRYLPPVDTRWVCEPATCPCCGQSLADSPQRLIRCQRVVEVPQIRTQVIEIQRYGVPVNAVTFSRTPIRPAIRM